MENNEKMIFEGLSSSYDLHFAFNMITRNSGPICQSLDFSKGDAGREERQVASSGDLYQ